MPIFVVTVVILLIIASNHQKKKAASHQQQKKQKLSLAQVLRRLLGFAAAVIIFALILGGGSDLSDGSAAPTNLPVTAKQTAGEAPTATPAPSSMPMPDYAAMSAEQAVQELATLHTSAQIELDYVMEYDGLVNVQAIVTDRNWNVKRSMQNICEYVLDISEMAFNNPGVDSLVFYFNADLRDAYGHTNRRRVINITISRATAEKINFDWMSGHIYISTRDFLAITDSYNVHQAFAEGVY